MIGAPRNRHVIVRQIERADLDVATQLGDAGVATVHEGVGRRGYLGPEIMARQADTKIGGTAVTVLSHPGDNLMVHAAIEFCQPGDVLVVATTAPSTHGLFGDLMATSLMARGVRGLVMDAAIRDLADLRSMGFPVWSRHVSVQGSVKATPGSVNVPVSIGGVVISPGDVICADDDGVAVVPRSEAEWALEQANARLEKEAGTRERLAAGELGVDFYGLKTVLADLGVEYVDEV